MLDSIGAIVRGLRGGSQAAKACMIITRTTGREVHSGEIERLKETGATGSYSNEYELALSHMISDCSDRYDILGELYAPLNQAVRDRVLRLYDSCESQGLIRSQYLRDEYQKIKALLNQQTQKVTNNRETKTSVDAIAVPHTTAHKVPDTNKRESKTNVEAITVPHITERKNPITPPKSSSSKKKWKYVGEGIQNTLTGELIPSKYLRKDTYPVDGYTITSWNYSTVWVQLSEIED